jgi:hypothetical protein
LWPTASAGATIAGTIGETTAATGETIGGRNERAALTG